MTIGALETIGDNETQTAITEEKFRNLYGNYSDNGCGGYAHPRATMRPLTEDEMKIVFEKISK